MVPEQAPEDDAIREVPAQAAGFSEQEFVLDVGVDQGLEKFGIRGLAVALSPPLLEGSDVLGRQADDDFRFGFEEGLLAEEEQRPDHQEMK